MENKIIKLDLILTQIYSLYVLDSDKENFISNAEHTINKDLDSNKVKDFINDLTLKDSQIELSFDKEIVNEDIRDPVYVIDTPYFPYKASGRFHTFEEALRYFRKGGKISRQSWGNNNAAGYVSLTKDGRSLTDNGVNYYFSVNDVFAIDWIFKD